MKPSWEEAPMNFNYILIKTFKANLKKFLSYFLCCSFSITVFFMYTTLILNNDINQSISNFGKEGAAIKTMIYSSLIALILFSIVFMSYSHSSFINCRKKEFELYSVLGMNKHDIKKLILFENLLIAVFSMLTGLISGSVFGRLFFMIVTKILNLNVLAFNLSYKNYLLTTCSFIVIFIVVIIVNGFISNKINDISKNAFIKSSGSSYAYLAVLGLSTVILSYVIMCFSKNNRLILSTVLCFLGTYLLITCLGNLILWISKKKNSFYHKNLLAITETSYNFNQNKKIIFVLSILSCIAIYFIGLAYSSYLETPKEVNIENPYDLVYVENSSTTVDLVTANDIVNEKKLQFITLNLRSKSSKINLISQSQFNSFANKNIHVNSGQFVTLTSRNMPESSPWHNGNILLSDDFNNKYELSYSYEIWQIIINPNVLSMHMLIINDADYTNIIKNKSSNFIKTYHAINLKNWTMGMKYERNLNNSAKVASKYEAYEILKAQNLFFLFIMLFIGMLFFISCGCILSFKLFSEIDYTLDTYNKLRGIGITVLEMKKLISFQFKIIFFVPAVLGSALGFSYILLQMKRSYFKQDLVLHSLIIILIYLCFQFIYYCLTEKKYFQKIKLFRKVI